MDTPDTEQPPEYVVTEQLRETAVSPYTNRIETGWHVFYHDNLTGTNGDVFVPDKQYTPAGVKQIILEQLALVRAVHRGDDTA